MAKTKMPSMLRWGLALAAVVVLSATNVVQAKRYDKLKAAFGFVSDFVLQKHSLEYTGGQQGLTVIGAGFPRTGTKSIESGLHSLGHRIYDMRSMFENGHVNLWLQAAEDWKERDDLKGVESLLVDMEHKGYTATLDFPMNLFSLAFAELRPEAKVLFSVRDNEQKWVESWRMVTILMGNFICRPWSWIIPDMTFNQKLLKTILDFDWKDSTYPDEISRPVPWYEFVHHHAGIDPKDKQQEWIELHQRYQLELQEILPANRFLIYNVKQGWAPLVRFLDIDNENLAEEDFPNINDRASLQIVRKVMDVIAIGLPLWILVILWVAIRIVMACFGCCFGRLRKPKAKIL
jgi:hypothetical protein